MSTAIEVNPSNQNKRPFMDVLAVTERIVDELKGSLDKKTGKLLYFVNKIIDVQRKCAQNASPSNNDHLVDVEPEDEDSFSVKNTSEMQSGLFNPTRVSESFGIASDISPIEPNNVEDKNEEITNLTNLVPMEKYVMPEVCEANVIVPDTPFLIQDNEVQKNDNDGNANVREEPNLDDNTKKKKSSRNARNLESEFISAMPMLQDKGQDKRIKKTKLNDPGPLTSVRSKDISSSSGSEEAILAPDTPNPVIVCDYRTESEDGTLNVGFLSGSTSLAPRNKSPSNKELNVDYFKPMATTRKPVPDIVDPSTKDKVRKKNCVEKWEINHCDSESNKLFFKVVKVKFNPIRKRLQICTICDRIFKTSSELKQHTKTAHNHNRSSFQIRQLKLNSHYLLSQTIDVRH